jgi:hypothetical protein
VLVYCANLLLAIILILTPFMLIFFIFKNYGKLYNNDEFKQKWGVLYEEFRNGGWGCMGYYAVFFLRRLVISVSFIILKDTPIIQLFVLDAACLLVLVYVSIYRPFKSKLINFAQIANEASILCSYCFCGLFYYDQNFSVEVHGWIILGCVYSSYILHLVVVLNSIIPAIIRIIVKIWHQRVSNRFDRNFLSTY